MFKINAEVLSDHQLVHFVCFIALEWLLSFCMQSLDKISYMAAF